MTKDELRKLGERAAACKHWRRMPGMLGVEGHRLLDVQPDCTLAWENQDGWTDELLNPDGFIPDLSDPATLGCLLALVREAWGKLDACARQSAPGVVDPPVWYVDRCPRVNPMVAECHATEAEALVAALEAVP